MARYYERVGFVDESETSPDVYTPTITEKCYYGDVVKNIRRISNGEDTTNDNVTVSNQLSIVADAYANQNFFMIRYAFWMGHPWKVTNVEVKPPRLILTLGEVYNGQTL